MKKLTELFNLKKFFFGLQICQIFLTLNLSEMSKSFYYFNSFQKVKSQRLDPKLKIFSKLLKFLKSQSFKIVSSKFVFQSFFLFHVYSFFFEISQEFLKVHITIFGISLFQMFNHSFTHFVSCVLGS